jgi:transposase-like protein
MIWMVQPVFISKKLSRPSNRRHSEEFRNAALDLIRERYLDFGPTLEREKLIESHRISVAKETLRQWMTEASRINRAFDETRDNV